jgi:hypothetical protein
MMQAAWSDHGVHYHNGKIYVTGGIASSGFDQNLVSLNSCEVYDIAEDEWY